MRKRQLSKIFEQDLPEQEKNTVNIEGKIVDLSQLSNKEKIELKLKEKVVLDKSDMDYPIVMVQMKDGKYIVFDVNGAIVENPDLDF